MNEKGAWFAILSTIILLSGFTGVTLYQDVFAASQKTEICHKPGTPAEKTMQVSGKALEQHKAHGDTIGACDVTAPPTTGFTKIKCNCEEGNNLAPVCTQIFCKDSSGNNNPERVTFCESVCQGALKGSTVGNTCENAAGCTLP